MKRFDSNFIMVGKPELDALLLVTDCVVFLTGGVVRDQIHDKPPRDIDMCLVGADEDDIRNAQDELEQLGWEMVQVFDRDDDGVYTDKFPAQEDRFDLIIKYQHADYLHGLDLLVYTDAFDNVAEAVASHDHNISQFAAFYSGVGFEVVWLGDPASWGVCRQTRRYVNAERIDRVKQIAMSLGWGWASPDFGPVPPPMVSHYTVPQEWLDDL